MMKLFEIWITGRPCEISLEFYSHRPLESSENQICLRRPLQSDANEAISSRLDVGHFVSFEGLRSRQYDYKLESTVLKGPSRPT